MIQRRLKQLRAVLDKNGLKAIIVYPADPHQSEYLPDYWRMRDWISGFTGSAGTAVITDDKAGLWTDSRYFIQAESELSGTEIELFRQGEKGVLGVTEWLSAELKAGDKVYWVAETASVQQSRKFSKALSQKDIILETGPDIFEELWKDRPTLPEATIYEHPIEFAITTVAEKIDALRSKLISEGADYFIAAALDETAWLLNLRGSDVDCNPVFLSWTLVGHESVVLFTQPSKIDDEIREKLLQNGVEIRPYEEVDAAVQQIDKKSCLWIDPVVLNCKIYDLIKCKKLELRSPIMQMKALKNTDQIQHISKAMIRDGVALFRAFNWLKSEIQKTGVKESAFAKKITFFRSQQKNYIGESFSAIVGYKGNGAIVHYHPTDKKSAVIQTDGMLLVDSGGQYFDGTTDITRTIHLGTPSNQEKEHFTLVLKGMIALSLAIFPEGTTGAQLDILARQFLWNKGLNFGHGTGHGVGYFLNVHEPPQGFVPQIHSERGKTVIEEGMISSNEPGFYKAGEYGIRSENLVVSKSGPYEGYLHFETLTLYPFDRKLIAEELLTEGEVKWIDEYHHLVFNQLSNFLDKDEQQVLKDECRPIKG
ncbi:MAG: aminopeptidase P family protein [Saprospirales bacterium]|nr:MAG: aminopeptidase P family protein [Saprospirales bacterium]